MIKTVNLSYYDTSTKEFLQTRATVVDDSDPSVDYIPYNATTVLAPAKSSWAPHTYPVFNGTDWDMVPDYRGVTFYHYLTQERKEYSLGESPDLGKYTDVPPTTPGTEWSFHLKRWVTTIESTRVAKRQELTNAYNNQMATPVTTDIKGRVVNTSNYVDVVVTFQTDDDRQKLASLLAMVKLMSQTSSVYSYKMADGTNVMLSAKDIEFLDRVQHTHYLQCNMKYWDLTTKLDLATTIDDINRIAW